MLKVLRALYPIYNGVYKKYYITYLLLTQSSNIHMYFNHGSLIAGSANNICYFIAKRLQYIAIYFFQA